MPDFSKWLNDPGTILHLIELAATTIIGIYLWISRNDKATNRRIDREREALDQKINGLGEHIQELATCVEVVKETLRNSITHHDLGQIYDQLRETNTTLNTVAGGFKALQRNLEIMQEALLREKL